MYKQIIAMRQPRIFVSKGMREDLNMPVCPTLQRCHSHTPSTCCDPYIYSDSSLRRFAAHMGRDWICGLWCEDELISFHCGHIVTPPYIDSEHQGNINDIRVVGGVRSIR